MFSDDNQKIIISGDVLQGLRACFYAPCLLKNLFYSAENKVGKKILIPIHLFEKMLLTAYNT